MPIFKALWIVPDNLICIMHFLYSQKHEKFNVAVEKEDKKRKFRPFAALTVASSEKYILTHFQKLKSFHLLMTQDSLLGKVWGKTFFRPEMQWTGFTDIVS